MAGASNTTWPPPRLAKPAQRALAEAGITDLRGLAKATEKEIAELHGMGPNAMYVLRTHLASHGLSFARFSRSR